MYKVLVVDDEPKTRRGIARLLLKQNNIWEVAGECENGARALEMVRDVSPDIVITDIRMPNMDGLEFIERLKNLKSDVEIIILSGFGQFDYAQKAIKFKVFWYLLKPLDEIEFFDVLDKARSAIDNKRQKVNAAADSEGNSDYFDDRIFNTLIRSEGSLKTFENFRNIMDIDEENYYIAAIEVEQWDTEEYGGFSVDVELHTRRHLKHLLIQHSCKGKVFLTNNNIWVLIVPVDEMPSQVCIDGLVKDIKEYLGNEKINWYSLGVSGYTEGFYKIPEVFKEAFIALKRYIYFPEEKVFFYKPDFTRRLSYPVKFEEKVLNCLKVGEYEQFLHAFNRFFDFLSEQMPDCYSLEEAINRFIDAVANIADEMQADPTVYDEQYAKLKQFDSFHNYSELREQVFIFMGTVFDSVKKILVKRMKGNMEKVIRYIDENYTRDLSLDEVAGSVGLNSSYFSNYFKAEMGTNFVEYITKLRMEKAKELLMHTNLKAYEIAEKLGYSNAHYFIRTFKKSVGVTPSEYKAYF